MLLRIKILKIGFLESSSTTAYQKLLTRKVLQSNHFTFLKITLFNPSGATTAAKMDEDKFLSQDLDKRGC